MCCCLAKLSCEGGMSEQAEAISRLPRATLRPLSPVDEVVPGVQGIRVFGALDPLDDGYQRGELVAGGGRIPRLPGPVGEVVAGGKGVRVLRAEDPLAHGQQLGVLVAGGGRIPRLPAP